MNSRYTVERIMEIISWVIGSHKPGASLTSVDTTELYKAGYTDGEISAAVSWILERGELGNSSSTKPNTMNAYRVLHGIEADVIEPEAWGLLVSYQNLGFLSADDVEQIIERAMMMGTETTVGLEEIRAIVAVFVMNLEDDAPTGNRNFLSGNEQVN